MRSILTTNMVGTSDLTYMETEAQSLGISLSGFNKMLAMAAVHDPVISKRVEEVPNTVGPRLIGLRAPAGTRKQCSVALHVDPRTAAQARGTGWKSIGEGIRRALILYRDHQAGGGELEVRRAFDRLIEIAGGLDALEDLALQKNS